MIRIVKMTFQEEKLPEFKELFLSVRSQIENFEGCNDLKIQQALNQPHIVFTISDWDRPEYLEKYRNSELFGKVWSTIKPWFSEKTEAWSMETMC